MRTIAIVPCTMLLAACGLDEPPTAPDESGGLAGRWTIGVPERAFTFDATMREPGLVSDGTTWGGKLYFGRGAVQYGDQQWAEMECNVFAIPEALVGGVVTNDRTVVLTCVNPPGAVPFGARFEAVVPPAGTIPNSLVGTVRIATEQDPTGDATRFGAEALRR